MKTKVTKKITMKKPARARPRKKSFVSAGKKKVKAFLRAIRALKNKITKSKGVRKNLRTVKKYFWRVRKKVAVFWFGIASPQLKALTLKKSCAIAGVAGVCVIIFIAVMFFVLSSGLPTVESLKDYKPSPGTTVFARDGRVLGQIKIEKGVYTPLDRVPAFMQAALLATEDPCFYRHHGLDYRGMLRAALTNILEVRVSQGGSTITQQLAKVVYLSPERNLTRKIKEIILACRLEKELSKKEILELYLNKIYFGQGAYGVQMAARTYFGKNIWEINQAEAALLAGLPRSPSAYSPYSDIDRAKLRQAHVLKRMVEEEYLTEDQSRAIYDTS
ncbi:MAG TPA: transglycosylase domain-containing protein, partial [Nitrospirota bacterium]|nr:transglycosylase domain-containing protein [Nitrospirota bacterium]